MEIRHIKGSYAIAQIKNAGQIDLSQPFTFLSRTDEELSLVCEESHVPSDALRRDGGWTMFGIVGQLDFALVGVLSGITALLADEGISVFALSTYNTDYIMVKNDKAEAATQVFRAAGWITASSGNTRQ